MEDIMIALTRHALIGLCAFAAIAHGQTDHDWTIRPVFGVAVPTGAHRHAFGATTFLGAQTSMRLTNTFDLVGSFGWQPSTGKFTTADNHADVLVYNVGIERAFRGTRNDRPYVFAGGGVGGRAYDFRSLSLESSACYAAYGNAGAGYDRGRWNVRAELRDNVFCYKPPLLDGDREMRNEASLSLGLGLRF
jgi:hypothetical protein